MTATLAALLLSLGAQDMPAPPAPPAPPTPEVAADGAERHVHREVRRRVDETGEVIEEEVVSSGVAPDHRAALETDCPTRAFVAEVELVEDGGTRLNRVILCSNDDDPETYRTMLNSAKTQLSMADELTPESRARLLAQIDAEIAALDGAADTPPEIAPGR